jgi:hypothetical protein
MREIWGTIYTDIDTLSYPQTFCPVTSSTVTHRKHCHHSVLCLTKMSRDSAVGIATAYGLEDRGVEFRVPLGSRIFSSPRRPDRLWGPPSFLTNGYRGLFPRG